MGVGAAMPRHSSACLLRRVIPLLLAVAALLGPQAASAAGPAPDPPGSSAPVPDPAPVAHPRVVHVTPVVVPVRRAVVAAPASAEPAATTAPATVATPVAARTPERAAAQTRKRAPHAEGHILDVPPLRVDVHRGLGAVTRTLHDDSLLVLAGIALLVATFTAASGAAVAVVAARAERRPT